MMTINAQVIHKLAERTKKLKKHKTINRPQENWVITKQRSTINTQAPYIK